MCWLGPSRRQLAPRGLSATAAAPAARPRPVCPARPGPAAPPPSHSLPRRRRLKAGRHAASGRSKHSSPGRRWRRQSRQEAEEGEARGGYGRGASGRGLPKSRSVGRGPASAGSRAGPRGRRRGVHAGLGASWPHVCSWHRGWGTEEETEARRGLLQVCSNPDLLHSEFRTLPQTRFSTMPMTSVQANQTVSGIWFAGDSCDPS